MPARRHARSASVRFLPIRFSILLLIPVGAALTSFACSDASAPTAPEEPVGGTAPPGLVISVHSPVAPDAHTAQQSGEYAHALREIRGTIPAANMVHLFVDGDVTGPADWAAILDATAREGFSAAIGFATWIDGHYQGYRPVRGEDGWELGPLADFVTCEPCVRHSAFQALLTLDEPWHHEKRPFYTTEDLQDLYATLKGLAPPGTDPPLGLQFSRELWRYLVDDPIPGLAWERGLCDIVQISALEFQDGGYQAELLEANHTWSRRIVSEATPEIPIWSSVQVFGRSYGPAAGYWFPREREGHSDLTTLLEDVTDPTYESIAALEGIMLQKWDSEDSTREHQFTLGDAVFPNQPAEQVEAAREAVDALNRWVGEEPGR